MGQRCTRCRVYAGAGDGGALASWGPFRVAGLACSRTHVRLPESIRGDAQDPGASPQSPLPRPRQPDPPVANDPRRRPRRRARTLSCMLGGASRRRPVKARSVAQVALVFALRAWCRIAPGVLTDARPSPHRRQEEKRWLRFTVMSRVRRAMAPYFCLRNACCVSLRRRN